MVNGDSVALDDAEAAEPAARRAIEADAGDWRAHIALAAALTARKRVYDGRTATAVAEASTARKRVQEAVVAARRAVALAPEEPDAHLALADALLAVTPRWARTRAAVSAALDRAEFLGVERRDLADRRDRNRPGDIAFFVLLPVWFLGPYAVDSHAGTVGRAVAGSALVGYLSTVKILRLWPQGESLREGLGAKRKLSRKRLETDELASRTSPVALLPLLLLVLGAAFLSIPGADDGAPPLPVAWLLLGGVPLVAATTWIAVDRWFGPGMTLRILRHNRFIAVSVSTAVILATASPAAALLDLQRSGVWFTLFLTQLAWCFWNLITIGRIESRLAKDTS